MNDNERNMHLADHVLRGASALSGYTAMRNEILNRDMASGKEVSETYMGMTWGLLCAVGLLWDPDTTLDLLEEGSMTEVAMLGETILSKIDEASRLLEAVHETEGENAEAFLEEVEMANRDNPGEIINAVYRKLGDKVHDTLEDILRDQ